MEMDGTEHSDLGPPTLTPAVATAAGAGALPVLATGPPDLLMSQEALVEVEEKSVRVDAVEGDTVVIELDPHATVVEMDVERPAGEVEVAGEIEVEAMSEVEVEASAPETDPSSSTDAHKTWPELRLGHPEGDAEIQSQDGDTLVLDSVESRTAVTVSTDATEATHEGTINIAETGQTKPLAHPEESHEAEIMVESESDIMVVETLQPCEDNRGTLQENHCRAKQGANVFLSEACHIDDGGVRIVVTASNIEPSSAHQGSAVAVEMMEEDVQLEGMHAGPKDVSVTPIEENLTVDNTVTDEVPPDAPNRSLAGEITDEKAIERLSPSTADLHANSTTAAMANETNHQGQTDKTENCDDEERVRSSTRTRSKKVVNSQPIRPPKSGNRKVVLIRANDNSRVVRCESAAHAGRLLGVDRNNIKPHLNRPVTILGWYVQDAEIYGSEEGQLVLNPDFTTPWIPSIMRDLENPELCVQHIADKDVEIALNKNAHRELGGSISVRKTKIYGMVMAENSSPTWQPKVCDESMSGTASDDSETEDEPDKQQSKRIKTDETKSDKDNRIPQDSNVKSALGDEQFQEVQQKLSIPLPIRPKQETLEGFRKAQLLEGLELGLFTENQIAVANKRLADSSLPSNTLLHTPDPYYSLSSEERRHHSAVIRRRLGRSPGQDVNTQDRDGRTPLHKASTGEGHHDVLSLIDSGANLLAQDKNGWTPLHDAGAADIALQLVAAGADPSSCSELDGKTPLHLAAEYGNAATLEVLLLGGGDPDVCDKWGKSAYDLAAGDDEVLTVLKEAEKREILPRFARPDENVLVNEHADNSGWKHRCPVCHKTFTRKSNFARHYERCKSLTS